MVLYGAVWCCIVPYGAVSCWAVWCCIVLYGVVLYRMVLYCDVLCCMVLYGAELYGAVLWCTPQNKSCITELGRSSASTWMFVRVLLSSGQTWPHFSPWPNFLTRQQSPTVKIGPGIRACLITNTQTNTQTVVQTGGAWPCTNEASPLHAGGGQIQIHAASQSWIKNKLCPDMATLGDVAIRRLPLEKSRIGELSMQNLRIGYQEMFVPSVFF